MKTFSLVVIALSVASLSGCAGSLQNNSYSVGQVRQAQKVSFGIVESVRQVKIEGTPSGAGSTAGVGAGAIAGSSLGNSGSRNGLVGMIAGAVIGGIAGAVIDKRIHDKDGVEITVKLELSGEYLAVTQEADENEPFVTGERARLLTSQSGVVRVTH
jgi:outer membrane lipoprotein SlyB